MIIELFDNDKIKILLDFVKFAANELGLKTLPRLKITSTPIKNKESTSFAAYQQNGRVILLYTKNRHIMDILRSLAHELVHHRQDMNGELLPDSGKTGSNHENEANAVAGQIMRRFGKLNPDLFVK